MSLRETCRAEISLTVIDLRTDHIGNRRVLPGQFRQVADCIAVMRTEPDKALAKDPALQQDDIKGKVMIIEAKTRDLHKHLHQAVLQAAAYCKRKEYARQPTV